MRCLQLECARCSWADCYILAVREEERALAYVLRTGFALAHATSNSEGSPRTAARHAHEIIP